MKRGLRPPAPPYWPQEFPRPLPREGRHRRPPRPRPGGFEGPESRARTANSGRPPRPVGGLLLLRSGCTAEARHRQLSILIKGSALGSGGRPGWQTARCHSGLLTPQKAAHPSLLRLPPAFPGRGDAAGPQRPGRMGAPRQPEEVSPPPGGRLQRSESSGASSLPPYSELQREGTFLGNDGFAGEGGWWALLVSILYQQL